MAGFNKLPLWLLLGNNTSKEHRCPDLARLTFKYKREENVPQVSRVQMCLVELNPERRLPLTGAQRQPISLDSDP